MVSNAAANISSDKFIGDHASQKTDIGFIPNDWSILPLRKISLQITDGEHLTPTRAESGYYLLSARNVLNGRIDLSDVDYVGEDEFHRLQKRCSPQERDVLISCSGTVGRVSLVSAGLQCVLVRSAAMIKVNHADFDAGYIAYFLQSERGQNQIRLSVNQGAQPNLFLNQIEQLQIAFPKSKLEQQDIAEALSDANALIESLEQLITKKRQIKQGAMHELLTGKKRLPGFRGEWETTNLKDVADCLDNVRVPLNEAQRAQMKGDYPYCGANGVLDYVSGYVIDDDIILMAEDGGYFDEYQNRPIAYRMIGKCWVNNHAHILKAKQGCDQSFLFYSLVHKNILPFLASGTRAKLNKSEMNKIEVRMPHEQPEQSAIAAILSDMDADIDALNETLAKACQIKQGMMQELLTGRIRLV